MAAIAAAKDVLQYDNSGVFPATGEAATLYIAADTGLVYRWDGAAYVATGLQPIANQTLLGNISGGAAVPVALNKTQVQTLLDIGWVLQTRTIAAPNATIPAHAHTATGAETNIDYVIRPKGTGALLAAIPDNTATGGNKRGNYAVDLQMNRSAADRVASGTYSVTIGTNNRAAGGSGSIAIGLNNQAGNGGVFGMRNNNANAYSGFLIGTDNTTGSSDGEETMLFGDGNSATSNGDKMAFGRSNQMQKTSYCYGASNITTADGGLCFGAGNQSLNNYNYLYGASNVAQGTGGTVFMFGSSNTCPLGSAQNGTLIFGGSNKVRAPNSSVFGKNGYVTYGYCTYFPQILVTTDKVSLRREQHGKATTTDATPTVLTATGTAATQDNALSLVNNSTAKVQGHVIARTAGGDYKCWKVDAVINRDSGGVSTIPTAAPVTAENATAGADAWDLTFTVSSELYVLTGTGAAGTTIKWFSVLDIKELGV